MEYQPLIINHGNTLPEPYLNEGGAFLTLPSQDQVMEFLLNEARQFIVWKHGGEYAKNLTIYPTEYKFDLNDPEGHIVTVRDDGHGYTIRNNYLEKGWTYNELKSEPICHYVYIANNRTITLPKITKDTTKNELLYNYSSVIDELTNFDISQLKPTGFKKTNEIDNINEIDSDWEFTSSSNYYDSGSDYNPTSSEFNEDDFEYARIPTPPPPPPLPPLPNFFPNY